MSASTYIDWSRLELETRILSSSLRTSLDSHDLAGIETTYQELSKLYPELLTDSQPDKAETNFYALLEVEFDSTKDLISAKYHKELKKNLERDEKGAQNNLLLLNAGTTLRNDRLRLSHDLCLARSCLTENDNEFKPSTIYFGTPNELPLLLLMLKETYVLEDIEIQGLINRSKSYPECSIRELLKQADCISKSDLQFYLQGELLIRSEVITLSEFKSAATTRKFAEPDTSWKHYFEPPEEPGDNSGMLVPR